MFRICSRMGRRIEISGKALANVISVWLMRAPKWVWGTDPDYERLRKQKRHDPSAEPNPRGIVAATSAPAALRTCRVGGRLLSVP